MFFEELALPLDIPHISLKKKLLLGHEVDPNNVSCRLRDLVLPYFGGQTESK